MTVKEHNGKHIELTDKIQHEIKTPPSQKPTNNMKPRLYFIEGHQGTGKTTVADAIIQSCKNAHYVTSASVERLLRMANPGTTLVIDNYKVAGPKQKWEELNERFDIVTITFTKFDSERDIYCNSVDIGVKK